MATTHHLVETKHFIQLMEKAVPAPNSTFLISCDVTNMYPSIPIPGAVEACKDAMIRSKLFSPTKSVFLLDLVRFVLTNGIIEKMIFTIDKLKE